MQKIQYFWQKRIEKKAAVDRDWAEEINEDKNGISSILFIGYFIKILKLILIIINIAFFVGFFWYLFCEFVFYYESEKL